MNVNFPPIPAAEVKGIKAVSQGLRDYGRIKLDKRTDPRGFDYYWFGLGRIDHTPVADTDLLLARINTHLRDLAAAHLVGGS